jgi:hypothetical protein
VFGGELHRIEQPQHFIEVATAAHRVRQRRFDLLVGADDEHRAHRRVVLRGAVFGVATGVRVNHVEQLGHLELRVTDQRVVDLVAGGVFDVFAPALVVADRIDAQPEDLGVALVELLLQPGHVAQLGRAHRREVLRMRKQNGPAVTDPFVKTNRALRRFGREVRRFVA